MAPLVDQQWRRFSVSRFDPWREQSPLVSLIQQILIKICISYLLQWLNVVHWYQVTVQIHELYSNLGMENGNIVCYDLCSIMYNGITDTIESRCCNYEMK